GRKGPLWPKKTRGGTVVASLDLRYGDLEGLRGKSAVADLSIDMLMRGTTRHTRQQIEDEFDKLKARVSIGGGAGGVLAARVETLRDNLAAVLRLLAEVLRQPSFPADQIAQLRDEQLQGT